MKMKEKIDLIFRDLKNEVITEKQAHQKILELFTGKNGVRKTCPSCGSKKCSTILLPLNRCDDCGIEWEA